MELHITKSAGFCFGVKNAVEKAINIADANADANVYTYGPIIHNNKVIEDLETKGLGIINNIEDVKSDDIIIIRSHGISKREYEQLNEKGARLVDLTCIYVKKIHKIVEDKFAQGYQIIIIGDPKHPEVKGVNGWCEDSAIVIQSSSDLENLKQFFDKICIVSQTTFNKEKWHEIVCGFLKISKEILIYNTICKATELRQSEAMELSKQVDAMVVIGGKESSNTQKLYEICRSNCPNTIFIEDANELDINKLKDAEKIGITGGASTPDNVIKGVVEKMKENENVRTETEQENEKQQEVLRFESGNKENIEDYFADYRDIHPGDVVEGRVLQVSDKEIFVDISYKSDGLLTADEVSYEPVNLKEEFKIGDMIKIQVLRMNDGEGNVVLSKKSLEKEEFYKRIYKAKEEGELIEVLVTGVNKGGLTCQYSDVRCFMPSSLSGIGKNEEAEDYKGKKLPVKIVEINKRRNAIELLISRKEIVREENQNRARSAFERLEIDQVHRGTVKALINSGIFVNIGDIDVFVPLSEISWRRIFKPQDAISEGQKVELLLIKVDKENLRATGSIKKTGKEPWEAFTSKYSENDFIDGTVVRFTDFGAFVELMDGVDGLIHISNLSDKRVNKPQDVVSQGQKIRAKIIKIDNEQKRVSLSLKETEE